MLSNERQLRSYDKALRLRKSFESDTVLLERKTFVGRIGSIGPGGMEWSKDVGRRREEGHILILSINRDELHIPLLLDALKQADTWKFKVPLWKQVEDSDERVKLSKQRMRQDIIRYKSSELFDRYVWKYKQRVSVPERIV